MSTVPEEFKYSAEHEWVGTTEDSLVVRVGITDFAQDALGEVVYVEHPEVGATVAAGDVVGEVESTKSVSDIFAPVAGEIVSVNTDLDENPGAVNSAPYAAGWLFEIKLAESSAADTLLSAADYKNQVG
ncbi:glycine cleavage system protein GcvH [Nesterenkonia sp. E16_7]|uniref:glycine cleavage system protein GcvH n=1 Tax=unclassified Nesterenkonia TaxID=2629769 RepID=UPI001A930FE6|nr:MULTISPECIES: glycine cleavage system protein GcvH [unclassified Nesterenkonia]MBO0596145.1 glycine cleavage system protein GcvH [Nesterenkonia sp. E16_10]MBO0599251.1 glycine cleavage system protein GcvH [Nesterenkonia sp. E16_7]